MTTISTDQIRDISIKTVEGFINDKIPLSQGLAKQASAYELNSEQIKRAVEATNSIAYLKILGMVDDRTVEFPLAKEAEVIQYIVLPDGLASIPDMQKAASIVEELPAIKYENYQLTEKEQFVHMMKLASINEVEIEDLESRSVTIVTDLLKVANVVKKDSEGIQKLSSVSEGVEFNELSILVYGDKQKNIESGIFKEAELKTVNQLVGLLKEAKEIKTSLANKKELQVKSELVKKAFLGSIGSMIGRVAGSAIAGPAKVIGAAAGRSASNVAGAAMNKGRTILGKAPIPMAAKKFGLGAGLVAGASIGFDALAYNPGVDKTTGRSKDVWDSLQREPN